MDTVVTRARMPMCRGLDELSDQAIIRGVGGGMQYVPHSWYTIVKRAVDHSLVKVKAHPSEPENAQANPGDIIQGFQRVNGKWFEEVGLRTVLNLAGKGIDTVHNDDGSKVWIPNGQYTIVKRASTPDEPFTYYTEGGVNHTIVHPSYGKEATCPSCHHSQPSDQAGEVCKRCGEAEYEAVRVAVREPTDGKAPEPSTAELVAMLAKREGVVMHDVGRFDAWDVTPYRQGQREMPFFIKDKEGPATILVVPGVSE